MALRCPLLLHLVQPRDKTSLKNRKKRSYGSRFQRSLRLRCCAQREQGSPRHMLPEAPGELDKRHTGPSGRSTNSDLPWTSAPRLPIQDLPNGAKSFSICKTWHKDQRSQSSSVYPKTVRKGQRGWHVTYDQLHNRYCEILSHLDATLSYKPGVLSQLPTSCLTILVRKCPVSLRYSGFTHYVQH